MRKPLMLFVIGLFFGVGVGFVAAATSGAKLEGHDHPELAHVGGAGAHSGHAMHAEHAAHDHDALRDVSGDGPAPTLAVKAHPDTGNAVNLEIMTENFVFAPNAVNGPHSPGQGHAHVYIDGAKYARLYGSWLHVSGLPAAGAEIRVTLNANSHETLAVGATPIEAIIQVPAF